MLPSRAILCVISLLLPSVVLAHSAEDEVGIGYDLAESAVAWDGSSAWIAGGGTHFARWKPDEGLINYGSNFFSTGLYDPTLVYEPVTQRVFIAGGSDGSGTLSASVKFYSGSISSGTPFPSLPSARRGAMGFAHGGTAYFVGGFDANWNPLTEIVASYVSNGFWFTRKVADLPSGLAEAGVAYDGTNAYFFGGYTSGGVTDAIQKLSLTTLQTSTVAALPSPMYRVSAAWMGTHALLLGGESTWFGFEDRVLQWTPGQSVASEWGASLPSRRADGSAFSAGGKAYAVGGFNDAGQRLRTITTVDPLGIARPSAPLNLQASATANGGELRLSWEPPAHGESVTTYVIERYDSDASIWRTIPYVSAPSTTYVDTNLVADRWYGYRVRAENSQWEQGPASDEAWAFPSETRPTPPRGLRAEPDLAPGRIKLTWGWPETHGGRPIDRYDIYAKPTLGGWSKIREAPGDAWTVTLESQPGGTNDYYLVAVNVIGGSDPSNTASAPSLGAPPPLGDLVLFPAQDFGVRFPTTVPVLNANCARIVTGDLTLYGSRVTELNDPTTWFNPATPIQPFTRC